MRQTSNRPALIFMWEQFAPYHIDRLEAVADVFGDRCRVVGIEVASRSLTYGLRLSVGGAGLERHVLFPDRAAEEVPWPAKLRAALSLVHRYRLAAVFLCNQLQPELLAALMLLSLRWVCCFALLDAKFDDRARRALSKALKSPTLRMSAGNIAGGGRCLAYYRLPGLPARSQADGYSAILVWRLRQDAQIPLAPGSPSHAKRDFVLVAQFVAKKNVTTAIRAYARFRASRPDTQRRLALCGGGPEKIALRAIAGEGVVFAGFVDPAEVLRTVARDLALVLPSLAEHWGLVVNEAVSLNIPVLCNILMLRRENAGARDTLVRTRVNGFAFEPGNAGGPAALMRFLADDEVTWRRMSLACSRSAPLADVPALARGVGRLVGAEPRRRGDAHEPTAASGCQRAVRDAEPVQPA